MAEMNTTVYVAKCFYHDVASGIANELGSTGSGL